MEEEVWRGVAGYEGLYEVSNKGRVRSVKGVLKPLVKRGGYLGVNLYRSGCKMKSMTVHRLIAIAFIENPECKRCINHKDFDRTNNNSSNLEWCTHKENTAHSIKRVLSASCATINSFNEKGLMNKPVIQYGLDGSFIKEYLSVSQASLAMSGKVTSTINNHIRNKHQRHTAYGFVWNYK